MARDNHQPPAAVREWLWSDFIDYERSLMRVPPLHEAVFVFAGGEIETDEPGTMADLAGMMGGL